MKRLASLILLVPLAACGGDDANVAGDFTIAVTNRDNGCMFANWVVGESSTGIPVSIAQDGTEVAASVEGGVGAFFDLVLGAHVYIGTVNGDDLFLELFGTRGQQMGNCSFTYNSIIDGSIRGDTLTGRIEYTAKTNANPDCAMLEGCITFQDFNGTRAPQ